jgi:hypothetical protein
MVKLKNGETNNCRVNVDLSTRMNDLPDPTGSPESSIAAESNLGKMK